MGEILHKTLPPDLIEARDLPGVRPVSGPWLRVDEAYDGQMARRGALLEAQRADVLWMAEHARAPAQELLDLVVRELAGLGWAMGQHEMLCPDGRWVALDHTDPLGTLGRLVQCDFCLLEKAGAEHVLQGAVLCFPASWRLSEKIGRPLTGIHDPVAEYDANLAQRVQRLFDGVQVGRPLWRFNQLWYDDPELFQPRSASAPRPVLNGQGPYFRSERQTIFRLEKSKWVVFAIHTYVLRAGRTLFAQMGKGAPPAVPQEAPDS